MVSHLLDLQTTLHICLFQLIVTCHLFLLHHLEIHLQLLLLFLSCQTLVAHYLLPVCYCYLLIVKTGWQKRSIQYLLLFNLRSWRRLPLNLRSHLLQLLQIFQPNLSRIKSTLIDYYLLSIPYLHNM